MYNLWEATQNELKACPFCGENIKHPPHFESTPLNTWRVYCGWCEMVTNDFESREAAAEFWNTRMYAQSEAET